MIFKLGIQGFQPFEKAKFQFGPGLTALIGPNSSGKTGILRALVASLRNPSRGVFYINWKCEQAVVAFQVDNDPPVYWRRLKKTVVYQIGADVYEKVGKRKIWDLYPQCRLPQDGTGRLLNFHLEGDVLFPFDRSPSECFTLFEDLFQISSTTEVLDLMKEDEKGASDREDAAVKKEQLFKDVHGKLCKITARDWVAESGVVLDKMKKAKEALAEAQKSLSRLEVLQKFLLSVKDLKGALVKWSLPEDAAKAGRDCVKVERLQSLKVPTSAKVEWDVISQAMVIERDLAKVEGCRKLAGLVPEKEEFSFMSRVGFMKAEGDLNLLGCMLVDARDVGLQIEANKEELSVASQMLSEYKQCPTCGQQLSCSH